MLVETGAGGGNYHSNMFVNVVENTEKGGVLIVSPVESGLLWAANP